MKPEMTGRIKWAVTTDRFGDNEFVPFKPGMEGHAEFGYGVRECNLDGWLVFNDKIAAEDAMDEMCDSEEGARNDRF